METFVTLFLIFFLGGDLDAYFGSYCNKFLFGLTLVVLIPLYLGKAIELLLVEYVCLRIGLFSLEFNLHGEVLRFTLNTLLIWELDCCPTFF